MPTLNITAKIWLAVGVFILGYVFTTGLGQIQDHQARSSLQKTSSALFPAAQHGQEAEAAFQRTLKGFGDAVITQDSSGVERAAADGQQAVAALKAIAAIPGLSAERSGEATALATSVSQMLTDARNTYGAVMAGALNDSTQEQMRSLAKRNDESKAEFAKLKEQLADDLKQQLSAIETDSGRQSSLALGMFGITLLVAGLIVHFTIKRAITGPVVRVIGGVEEAADETGRAAVDMAKAGEEVSQNAQEQAACIEETSASLEEISTTTRKNAAQAGEADKLMHVAQLTIERAAQAMNDLTASMNLIFKSSNQVAGVLKTIDQIAFQTNILALNAAVEAARAGEAGAGFSVVADEVRSLAHRSADAARDSGAIIDQTVLDVSKGVELASRAHGAFQEVSTTIASGTQIVSEIAASSNEQALGVAHIRESIMRIEALTHKNVAHAQQTEAGAAAMIAQIETTRRFLDELVVVVGSGGA